MQAQLQGADAKQKKEYLPIGGLADVRPPRFCVPARVPPSRRIVPVLAGSNVRTAAEDRDGPILTRTDDNAHARAVAPRSSAPAP